MKARQDWQESMTAACSNTSQVLGGEQHRPRGHRLESPTGTVSTSHSGTEKFIARRHCTPDEYKTNNTAHAYLGILLAYTLTVIRPRIYSIRWRISSGVSSSFRTDGDLTRVSFYRPLRTQRVSPTGFVHVWGIGSGCAPFPPACTLCKRRGRFFPPSLSSDLLLVVAGGLSVSVFYRDSIFLDFYPGCRMWGSGDCMDITSGQSWQVFWLEPEPKPNGRPPGECLMTITICIGGAHKCHQVCSVSCSYYDSNYLEIDPLMKLHWGCS
ncbi:hypothetical protein C8R45DRAFT_928428 [Mycena sanguinolenta]|nr:hypothetical protein C8R45DRAFT_928428 [Mycena sanguinolenta]